MIQKDQNYANFADRTVTREQFILAYKRIVKNAEKYNQPDIIFNVSRDPVTSFIEMFGQDYIRVTNTNEAFPVLCKYQAENRLLLEEPPFALFCQLLGIEFQQFFKELHLIAQIKIV